MRWVVFCREAYEAWVNGWTPSFEEEADMVVWLEALERNGPPPVASERTIGTIPVYESSGPHGERVTFRNDQANIGIIDIRPWPTKPHR